MSNKENNIDNIIKNTFDKIKDMIDANIVFGKNVKIGDNNYIVPVSKVNVGIISGGGVGGKSKCENMGSSTGFSVVPIGFITIINDVINFISVNAGDSLTQSILENLFKLTERIIDNEVEDEK